MAISLSLSLSLPLSQLFHSTLPSAGWQAGKQRCRKVHLVVRNIFRLACLCCRPGGFTQLEQNLSRRAEMISRGFFVALLQQQRRVIDRTTAAQALGRTDEEEEEEESGELSRANNNAVAAAAAVVGLSFCLLMIRVARPTDRPSQKTRSS